MKQPTRTVAGLLTLCLLLPLGAGVADGLAATGDIRKDPSAVIKAYFSLDMKGARLDASSWETLKPYVLWTEEPVWEHATVIDGYEVVEDVKTWRVIGQLEALIPVRLHVVGVMYWETAAFVPETQVRDVRVRVRVVEGKWRIIEPHLAPHVGRKRLINFVRQAMLEETDPDRLAKLTKLRDDLRQAGPQAEPQREPKEKP